MDKSDARRWWQQDFWMWNSISNADFEEAFFEKFPEGEIDEVLELVEFPDFVCLLLLVLAEQRDALTPFIVTFCRLRGYSFESAIFSPEPESDISLSSEFSNVFYAQGNNMLH